MKEKKSKGGPNNCGRLTSLLAQTRAKKKERNRDEKQRIHLQKAYRRMEPVAGFKLDFSPQLTSST